MNQIENLRDSTEAAYTSVVNALVDLVNAITEERDYYQHLCEKKEQQ